MRCPKWITAQDIDRWAATPQAKSLLPELLRRLVFATVRREHLKNINFPAGAEFQRPGYDGTTVVTQGTTFVPDGICFWELGCDVNNPKGKAQGDYDKRIDEHKERLANGETENLAEATYVAVTASDWQKGGDWAKERNKEKYFKEVHVYDSNRLEHWIQDAPAVSLWLAQEIRGPLKGVIDLSEHWKNVQATLRRPLPPAVLLVNRDEIKKTFANWLEKSNEELVVKAPSPSELIAVFCVWVQTLPKDEQDVISSRAIIVDERETWRALATSLQPLILIASQKLEPEPELFAEAVRKGHHVLYAANRATRNGIELAMMRRFDLQTELQKAGFSEPESRQLAEAAGGNFTILWRRLLRTTGKTPGWAEDGSLAPLLLAASWDDNAVGDQRIISELAGQKYPDVQTLMTKWRHVSDAPVRFILGTWEFLSPVDAWEALNPFLNSSHIDRFQKIAVEVLTEDNPALELPPEERFMAAVKGKKCQFSQNLRRGIAEILALGATREEESGVAAELQFASRIKFIVKQILPDNCGWKRWASLGQLLSLLMEAAPETVLEAIEADIKSPDSQLVELLRQEIPGGIMGAAYHSGVLWALETAAWPEKHVQRVSLCLTRLAKLDPGGKWANRPSASAAHIFFSWRPQTMATVSKRIEILQFLSQKEPETTWKLILNLFPEPHGTFMDSSKPLFRSWAAGWTGEVSDPDSSLFLSELAKMAVAFATANPNFWPDLLDRMTRVARFVPGGFENGIAALEKFSQGEIDDGLRTTLWQSVRKIVQEQTYFRDAWWALPSKTLSRLAAIEKNLAPADAIVTSAHLFNDDGMMEGSKEESYEQKQERRNEARRNAIKSIWKTHGIIGILELAEQVRQPWAVGISLFQEIGDEAKPSLIPSLLVSDKNSDAQVATAFAANQIHTKGIDWAEDQPSADWSEEQLLTWSLNMPFEARTWDWIATKGKGIEKQYWSKVRAWAFGNLTADASNRAVKQFQTVGRAWSALEHLNIAMHANKVAFAPEFVCEVLDAILINASERKAHTMDIYHIEEAFAYLHQHPDVDETRVSRLEFSFLPFLDSHSRQRPMFLHRQLAREPEFFVDCLKLLFYPRHATEKEKAANDSQKAEMGQRIWHLLRDWHKIPGSDDAGNVSPDKLNEWVRNARKLAKESDRLEVCDLNLGEVFARGGEDVDKAMPLIAIRNVIEECESEELERGLCIGFHNRRGVVSKSLYEGGKQERELAETYQRYADACSKWPRTAAALRRVAEDYINQARTEDERAKIEQ